MRSSEFWLAASIGACGLGFLSLVVYRLHERTLPMLRFWFHISPKYGSMFGQEGWERITEQSVKIRGTYQDVLDKGSGWKPQGVDLIYDHQTHKFHTGLATRWDLWPNHPEDSLDDSIDYGTRFGVREAWD